MELLIKVADNLNAGDFCHCYFAVLYYIAHRVAIFTTDKKTKIEIHLLKQKSGHAGPEDTDTCPTDENNTTQFLSEPPLYISTRVFQKTERTVLIL